jgi:hypothetical protein
MYPQHQRIDKETNHAFKFLLGAVSDGGAHQNVPLATIAVQQSLEGGQLRHEERDTFLLA